MCLSIHQITSSGSMRAVGYGCVYLSSYSPELNPNEQFRSVVESKSKREKLLETETLNVRITEACQNILFSDLKKKEPL